MRATLVWGSRACPVVDLAYQRRAWAGRRRCRWRRRGCRAPVGAGAYGLRVRWTLDLFPDPRPRRVW